MAGNQMAAEPVGETQAFSRLISPGPSRPTVQDSVSGETSTMK
jgi:hypothetical protein